MPQHSLSPIGSSGIGEKDGSRCRSPSEDNECPEEDDDDDDDDENIRGWQAVTSYHSFKTNHHRSLLAVRDYLVKYGNLKPWYSVDLHDESN